MASTKLSEYEVLFDIGETIRIRLAPNLRAIITALIIEGNYVVKYRVAWVTTSGERWERVFTQDEILSLTIRNKGGKRYRKRAVVKKSDSPE